MSKAYYFVKNFSLPEAVNLMCYSTKFPHALTSTQRASRLYRAFLRRQYNINISENRADPETFHHEVNTAFHDFKRIINVPEDSPDYVDTMHHYETWVKDNIDPTMIIHESRPYAAGSSKYYIFDDGQLNFDPYGYYKPRNTAGRNPGEGFLFYADYPQDNNHWVMNTPAGSDTRDLDSKEFAQ